MKKFALLFLLSASLLYAQDKNVTLKINFPSSASDTLNLIGYNDFKQSIPKKENGVFEATFEVKDGLHQISDGKIATLLFLKNGFNLEIQVNPNDTERAFVYKGNGEKENNFLLDKNKKDEAFEKNSFTKEKDEFLKLKELYKTESETELDKANLDASFVKQMKMMNSQYFQYLDMMYEQEQVSKKLEGAVSPSFDYENYKGGTTKLEDLKGKVVYIDVWATWCAPCRAEIPYLKKLEEKYHDKDIAFVSISVDVLKDHEKWKKFVKDKELGGIQLFADKDWKSQFVKEFAISGIPRFILIDKEGKVFKANAPRPSSNEITSLLDEILK